MKSIDKVGLILCKYQAKLFEYSVKQKVSSRLFIKKFSHSFLAERMDFSAFLLESIDVPQAYIEVVGETQLNGPIYNEAIMSWIGYIYRYICYTYSQTMSDVYKRIKPKDLYELYDAYHSMDNELAIKRILEAKSISFEIKDDIELFKKIYHI